MHNGTLSVAAMRVRNPDGSPLGIQSCHPVQTPSRLAEIVSDEFRIFHAHLNAVYVFWNPGQAGSQEIYLPCDRCRDGTGLNLCATRLFRRIQQKLAAAKINGSRPFAHAKNRLLAKACDRLILESQLTPGLDTGLHGRIETQGNAAKIVFVDLNGW